MSKLVERIHEEETLPRHKDGLKGKEALAKGMNIDLGMAMLYLSLSETGHMDVLLVGKNGELLEHLKESVEPDAGTELKAKLSDREMLAITILGVNEEGARVQVVVQSTRNSEDVPENEEVSVAIV